MEKKFDNELNKTLEEFRKDSLFSLDNDSVKKAYTITYLELRSIINKHDPIGLLSGGAPEDEYDPEVKTIIVQLTEGQSEQQILDLIYKEFLRWFGKESIIGPKEAYKSIAFDIYNWKHKEKN